MEKGMNMEQKFLFFMLDILHTRGPPKNLKISFYNASLTDVKLTDGME